MVTGNGSPVTSHLVVPLVPHHYYLSTLWITPVPVSPTTLKPPRAEVLVNSMVWSMFTRRHLPPTVSPVSTVDLFPQSSASLSTAVSSMRFTFHRFYPTTETDKLTSFGVYDSLSTFSR